MRHMTLQEVADYLEDAEISRTIDVGYALIHIGTHDVGHRFVLVNDMRGDTFIAESM